MRAARGPGRGRAGLRVAVVLVALAGCAADDGTTPATGPHPPTTVTVARADVLVVPGPGTPAGVWLEDVRMSGPGAESEVSADPARPIEVLYDDPDGGPALAVGRSVAADDDSAGVPLRGGQPVVVRGTAGRVVEAGDLVVVAWDLPPSCEACGQEAFVAGRGLDRARVVEAARHAVVGAGVPWLPPDHRAGLPRSSVLGSAFGGIPQDVEELTFADAGGHLLSVAVAGADPLLAAHLRFWRDLGAGDGGYGAWQRIDQDTVEGVLVVASGRDPGPSGERRLLAILDSLVAATPRTWAAARAEAERPETCVRELLRSPGFRELRGDAGAAGWDVALAVEDGRAVVCRVAEEDDGAPLPHERVERVDLGPPAGGVRPLTGAVVQLYDGMRLRWAIGDVPAGTARVEVTVAGLDPVGATLAPDGPAAGRRWYAAAVDVGTLVPDGAVALTAEVGTVAYGADGHVLARTTEPR